MSWKLKFPRGRGRGIWQDDSRREEDTKLGASNMATAVTGDKAISETEVSPVKSLDREAKIKQTTNQVETKIKTAIVHPTIVDGDVSDKSNKAVAPNMATIIDADLHNLEKLNPVQAGRQSQCPGLKDPPSRDIIILVTENLGDSWRKLARILVPNDSLEVQLDDIERNYRSSYERANSVLNIWHESGSDYSVQHLLSALEILPKKNIIASLYQKGLVVEGNNKWFPVALSVEEDQKEMKTKSTEKAVALTKPVQAAESIEETGKPEDSPSQFIHHVPSAVDHPEQASLTLDALTILEFRDISFSLDPYHPNGNWRNLGRKYGFNDDELDDVNRDCSIDLTPAYCLLKKRIPETNPTVTISDVVNKLNSEAMRRKLVAFEVEKKCTELNIPMTKLIQHVDDSVLEYIANSINDQQALLGDWRILAGMYEFQMPEIRAMERIRQHHSPTVKLLEKVNAKFYGESKATLSSLHDNLRKIQRNDVALIVKGIMEKNCQVPEKCL